MEHLPVVDRLRGGFRRAQLRSQRSRDGAHSQPCEAVPQAPFRHDPHSTLQTSFRWAAELTAAQFYAGS
jgi:hypothetical protein